MKSSWLSLFSLVAICFLPGCLSPKQRGSEWLRAKMVHEGMLRAVLPEDGTPRSEVEEKYGAPIASVQRIDPKWPQGTFQEYRCGLFVNYDDKDGARWAHFEWEGRPEWIGFREQSRSKNWSLAQRKGLVKQVRTVLAYPQYSFTARREGRLDIYYASYDGTNTVSEGELPGTYYNGDGLGVNIYLDIQSNHAFNCVWRGCLGEYGKSTGTWSFITNRLILHPESEIKMLKEDPLREFLVEPSKADGPLLILANTNSWFWGERFLKKKETNTSNKPLETP